MLKHKRLTQRKRRREVARRQTEERFRALVEHILDGLALVNEEGEVLYASPSTSQIMGYIADELIGRRFLDFIHPDDRERAMTRFAEVRQSPPGAARSVTTEYRIRHKDGTWRWVEAVGANLLAEPSVRAVVGSYRDITERKQAEEARLQLAAIVESSDDAIIGTTLDATILTWNPGATKIYGYSAMEVIGRSISILAPPDRATEYLEIVERLLRGEHVDHFETIRVRKGGTHFHLSLTVSLVLDAAGKTIGTAGIGRDITERKRAEEALWRAREAERANQAKSDFLSRMSHELRTPLNAILGFAQLLEMDKLSPEHRESVGHILEGGRHILELINEVLDMARIEAGRLAIELEPVALREVVREALDLITPLAAERNVRIDPVTGTPERYIRADRQRIRQVLLNFLSNAVKYNHRGGSVTVGYEHIPGGRLRIKVSDTGPGIPPDKMRRLFTPFDRLGAEQTDIEGTGLGLALSKRLVEAMGGTLGVESTVGRGSTFWVECTLVEGHVEQSGQDVPLEAFPKACLLLYIEDELSNLGPIKRLLAPHPEVRLIPAKQGQLGLALARQHRPHLILLDVQLPDMGCEEVLRRLKEDPETRQIPVLVISADATSAQVDRLLTAGARACLTRPLDTKKLLLLLNEILREEEPGHAGRPTKHAPS